MNRYLPYFICVLICISHQANGIYVAFEQAGMVSGDSYQFWDDFGNDLALVLAGICVWRFSGQRIWRLAGLFITIAAGADTMGLWLNPDHYDSWKWELACAVFSSGVLLALRYCFPRRFENSAPPPQKPYRSTRIGFTGRGKE